MKVATGMKVFTNRSALVVAWITLFISFGDWAVDRYIAPLGDAVFATLTKTTIVLIGSTIATITNNRKGMTVVEEPPSTPKS